MNLVRPTTEHLPSYIAALEQGWSPDTARGAAAAREILDALRTDPAGYLEKLVDREAKGPPIVLPDGNKVPRLPGYSYWLWDGEFCGSINFRWQKGTTDLPPTCLGHVGYAVVPWKWRLGYATEALRQLLPIVKLEGLPFIEITTDATNHASQRVITANGGLLVEQFVKSAAYGNKPALRFRLVLEGS
jgi:predicted acetyltransferase